MLSDADKRLLLATARLSLEVTLGTRPPAELDTLDVVGEPGGVFVTIWRLEGAERRLRGCIGKIIAEEALSKTVVKMTAEAATKDPRFPPVTADELPELLIEVSILSIPEPAAPEDVIPGEHGIILRRGPRTGLLLPQVATERDWDRETFLDHGCLKAGLKPGCWKDELVSLSIFTATVFDESSLPM
jgi:uncharacterized protein